MDIIGIYSSYNINVDSCKRITIAKNEKLYSNSIETEHQ